MLINNYGKCRENGDGVKALNKIGELKKIRTRPVMIRELRKMNNHLSNYEIEAKVIGKYLLGKPVNPKAIDLYIKTMEKLNFLTSSRDKKRMAIVLKYRFLLPFIDAGLALGDRNSAVRKRIFIMLALLESIPEYSDKFLARRFSSWYLFKIFLAGVRGVFRGIVGYFLVKLI